MADEDDPPASADEPQVVAFSELASSIPSESLTDWVDLALFVAVVEVDAESVEEPATALPATEPVGMAASILNAYEATIVEVVWQDEDGMVRAGDAVSFAGSGWLAIKTEEGFVERPHFPYLEVGERYVVALAQHFEGVGPLVETAVIPVDQSGTIVDWNVADADGNPWTEPAVSPQLANGERLQTAEDFRAALGRLPVPLEIRRSSQSAIDRHLAILEQTGGD